MSSSQYAHNTSLSARWSELPNELLVQIMPHLAHQDLVNFATTCKWLHNLARDALQEHQDLMQRWGSHTNSTDWRTFTRLYRRIVDDPTRALYVRRLDIWHARTWSYLFSYPTTPNDVADLTSTIKEAERGDFSAFIVKYLLYSGINVDISHELESFLWGLRNGDEMATMIFLCSLLPNLNDLIFRCDDYAAAGSLLELENGLRCGHPNAVGEGRFCNLKSVEIHGGWHLDNPVNLLMSCAQIPSVEKLLASTASLDQTPSELNVRWNTSPT